MSTHTSEQDDDNPILPSLPEMSDDAASAAAASIAGKSGNERLRHETAAMALLQIQKTMPDLVERALRLSELEMFTFPDKVVTGNVSYPLSSDRNRLRVLSTLLSDEEQIHFDTFRGRTIDHKDQIVDKRYPIIMWLDVFGAAGLKNKQSLPADAVRNIMREMGNANSRNDLVERLIDNIPRWDGVPRMRTYLMDLFETGDTELNRDFGIYFWLSLYSRVMMPGCNAPIALSLIGAQNCGKSYFGKRLAQIILGDPQADTVQLDLGAKEHTDFFRSITGISVIASVAEMTGLWGADMNKVKAFMTTTVDMVNFKYEPHVRQSRQWIVMMDGNKYDGLQRDDTGNRRFYPMFCGQIADHMGKPAWRADFQVPSEKWDQLEVDLWLLFAEAREWLRENDYNRMVNDTSLKVAAFSMYEMSAGRGTIQDDDTLDSYVATALQHVELHVRGIADHTNSDAVPTVHIQKGDLSKAMDEAAQKQLRVSPATMKRLMTKIGSVESQFKLKGLVEGKEVVTGKPRSWAFENCESRADMFEYILRKTDFDNPIADNGDADERVIRGEDQM